MGTSSPRVVVVAKSFGYGSVAKAVALARLLPEVGELVYVGDAATCRFVAENCAEFDEVRVVADAEDLAGLAEQLRDADLVVAVRNPAPVFVGAAIAVPVVLFDSLFAFWSPSTPLPDLVAAASWTAGRSLAELSTWYAATPPHDRILLAHMVADHAFAQQLPGVADRIAALAGAGARRLPAICGPVVAAEPAQPASSMLDDLPAGSFALVNLGGVHNDYNAAAGPNPYVSMILEWVRAERPAERVIVCGGPFDQVPVEQDGVITARLPRARLRRLSTRAARYLCAAGLTSLCEAVVDGVVPELLPEAHFGHIFNIDAFAGTVIGDTHARLRHVLPDFDPPREDRAGSRYIADGHRRIVADPTLSARLRAVMRTAHERHRDALGAGGTQRVLARLRGVLDGRDPAECLRQVVDQHTTTGRTVAVDGRS